MNKIIFHIDMDAYFASIEQALNPSLKGKPVVVCGEGDPSTQYSRTIIVTASYEARKFGIKTGMTVREGIKLCPDVKIVVGNHERYISTSRGIQEILLTYTDLVEVYSIDECFVDMSQYMRRATDPSLQQYGWVIKITEEIKKLIFDKFRITCSIGIGPNKLVAKMAGEINKPDGLRVLERQEFKNIFADKPIETLWGIGRGIKKRLNALDIVNIEQLGKASPTLLKNYFGIIGQTLQKMGNGIYSSSISSYYDKRIIKSVGHSYTLPRDTEDLEVIKSYLLILCDKVADRLIKYKLTGRTFTFSVRFHDFSFKMKRFTTQEFTNNRFTIFHYAFKILRMFFPLHKKIRLLGISVSSVAHDYKQTYILSNIEKSEKINKLIFEINKKYGKLFIKPALVLVAQRFVYENKCGLIGKHIFDDL